MASRVAPFAQSESCRSVDELEGSLPFPTMGEDLGSNARSFFKYNKLNETLLIKAHQERYALTVQFIQDYIKQKECTYFVPKKDKKRKPEDPVRCHCGDIAENHVNGARGVPEFYEARAASGLQLISAGTDPNLLREEDLGSTAEWKSARDIQEFNTNSFGKIAFINEGLGGHKPSKFVRMADNTSLELVMTLLIDHWRMLEPSPAHLVISVIGGAKNFKLDGKRKEVFNRGLVNAAQTTSAWILTSGFNMGVMKAVGEAVAEGQSYNWDKLGMTHSIRCIGIAPWGYVEQRNALTASNSQGLWNATYRVSNVIRHGHPVSLNPDHTHFLLIDDGNRNRYVGVADFRAKFERKISLPVHSEDGGETGLGIPVVLVVVEGGYDAILDVRKSLTQQIPVVICEGTGRAADIISYAYNHTVAIRNAEGRMIKDQHKRVLEDKLLSAFGSTWRQRGDAQKEVEKFLNIIVECCQDEKLITVFDMNKHEELDLAILSALLKGQGASNITQLRDQLKLALTWNRSDVVEDKIFNNQVTWPPGYLYDIMTQSLVEDKVNFIRLLLQNGDVVMHEYLTVPRLRKLYNSAPKMSHLRKLLSRSTKNAVFLLQDVDKLLRKLMSKHVDDHYGKDNDVGAVLRDEDAYTGPPDQLTFPKPFRELFVWSVLMNRIELAKFLWERCDEAIPGAIAASRIYDSLANKVAAYDSDLLKSYKDNKREFEQLAIKVLDECQNTDPEKAAILVRRKYETWGGINCLQMAATADDKEFLSTVCCQNILDMMWKRGISSDWFKTGLSIIFFPLILCLVRFHKREDNAKRLTAWKKVHSFYSAPCVKFTSNVMMYFVFLFLYSWLILFEFRPAVRPLEYVVLLWMCTFLLEELREMLFDSQSAILIDRISDWWKFSFFNRIDLLVLICALAGVILRCFPHLFIIAKTFYAINCIFIWIRLLQFYSASSYLGPKLVMITKMMVQLLLYITIMMVFLLAYGISINAVMYPIRDFTPSIFKDILYYPTWQISGELFLDEIEGSTPECEAAPRINGTKYKPNGSLCPEFNALVPILTALYLLMANVLLLNLLIAIFTHVFEEVQTNSIQIWKYGMYFLVVEYETKPILAPPFIVFSHIYQFFRWIVTNICQRKASNRPQYADRQQQLMEIFEKEMTRSYIRKRQTRESRPNTDNTVFAVLNGVHGVIKLLEEEKVVREKEEEKMLEQQTFSPQTTTSGHGSLRWPSLDQIRHLKYLGSIKEDQSSTDGQSPVPFGSNSETDALATVDYNIRLRRRLSTGSDDETPKLNNGSGEGGKGGGRGSPVVSASTTNPNTWNPPPKSKRRRSSTRKHGKRGAAEEVPSARDIPTGGGLRADHLRAWDSDRAASSSDEEVENAVVPTARAHRQPEVEVSDAAVDAGREQRQGDGAFSERLRGLEEKLELLEETTTRSLHNIETMLRNAVFQRGAVVTSPGVEPWNYALQDATSQGARGRVVAPQRDWAAQPPYRRNLHFPP